MRLKQVKGKKEQKIHQYSQQSLTSRTELSIFSRNKVKILFYLRQLMGIVTKTNGSSGANFVFSDAFVSTPCVSHIIHVSPK